MKLALAGDTMLGRGVAERLRTAPPATVVADQVVEITRDADLFVLNLECAVSDRGAAWPDPDKPFFFRAPPRAVDLLVHLGVDCVTLANNHALDYRVDALLDTVAHLDDAGIAHVGAGPDLASARAPVVLEGGGTTVGVVGLTDHPRAFAAGADRPGVAYAELGRALPEWIIDTIQSLRSDTVLVTPHWGPNMVPEPVPWVRRSAAELTAAGATVVAGHSAHVFHGVDDGVLFDLGDFIDDYATHESLRNDLGLLFVVSIDGGALTRIEAVPLKLDYCHTRLATGEDHRWIAARFKQACAEMGTVVSERGGRLTIDRDQPGRSDRADHGHRSLPHTADVLVEAWGADLASCCTEAVTGLLSLFVEADRPRIEKHRPIRVDPGPPDALLLSLLDAVVFITDTERAVPVSVDVVLTDDGGLEADVELADRDSVEVVGSAPKAIARSEFHMQSTDRTTRCRFLVDV